ncbi:purine phosphorylase [Betaproteobacteria bacterium PRO4]|nr:purine phosphorylase [Betaproteobacteria bacterium PRO4]
MNRTGIVIAMRSEAACITSQRHLPFDQAVQVDDHLVIRLCGMGPVAARRAAAGLHAEEKVTRLISFGIAGALDDNLQPGDLVLPESVQTKQSYATDSAWRTRIEHSLPTHLNVIRRPVAASDELVATADQKYALAARSGACAVDMESGAIAAVAAEKKVPFIVIRVISDPVQFSPPAALMDVLHPDGRVKPALLMAHLLKRSLRLSELLRLGSDAQIALKTLKQVAQSARHELRR